MSDPIERQDVSNLLDSVSQYMGNWLIQYIEDGISSIPSAQLEQQWIPCSKTTDIPDHEVLCCDRHGEELIGWLSYNDAQWFCESNGEMMYDTIAWREKPEPYRGDQDE